MEEPGQSQLEIAHVLFMDVVGYSKLPIDQQQSHLHTLQELVRATSDFIRAEQKNQLVRLPAGDGMALVFFGDPEAPVRCALELASALRAHSEIRLRMGIHTGPVYHVSDINAARNVAGSGINMAQRVMDCGDAGHILVSKAVADVLAQISRWSAIVHELGEAEVKHGVSVHLYNVYTGHAGNPETPEKLERPLVRAPTSTGLSRTWRQAVGVAAMLVVGIGVLAWWTGYWPWAGSAAAEPPLVAIVPFHNQTGEQKLEWLGDGFARLLTDSLAQSRHVRVGSADRVRHLMEGTSSATDLTHKAQQLGFNYLVSGEILGDSGLFAVSGRVIDTNSERETSSRQVSGLRENAILSAVQQLSASLKKGLGIPPAESVDSFAADFVAQNPGAYESYIAGLEALLDYHYPEAERNFLTSLNKAPSFAMARYRLATVYAATGRTDEALNEITKASVDAAQLSDREKRYIAAAKAYYSRHYEDAIREYRQMIEHYPYESEPRVLLAELYLGIGEYDHAVGELQTLTRIEPNDHVIWSLLGSAELARKHFDEAVKAFSRFVELEPESANSHDLLADSYRAQGQLDAAAKEYAKALQIDPSFHFATISLATVNYYRGQRAAAERLLITVVNDSRASPRLRNDAAFALADVRRAEGRFRDAAKVLESIEESLSAEKVREAMAYSIRAVSAAETGDFSQALYLIKRALEHSPGVPTRYLFAEGIVQLRMKQLAGVRETTRKIRERALPAGNPDRTEDKAAAYLNGKAMLLEKKTDDAIRELAHSVEMHGYEYSNYRLALAEAYASSGRAKEAREQARLVIQTNDYVNPRLDLELDRNRAHLLLARVEKEVGNKSEAAAQTRKFLQAWSAADSSVADVSAARELLASLQRP
jgi:tetratricopeptide (TPR) repeat protein/class 3 adenylate cyclase